MKKVLYLIIISLLFTICSCNIKNENSSNIETATNNSDTITTQVFKTDDGGWGYDILINRKPYIHQTIIPSINGRFSFKTQEDARRTSAHVVTILLKNNGLPSTTFKELDSLGVLYPEVLEFQEQAELEMQK